MKNFLASTIKNLFLTMVLLITVQSVMAKEWSQFTIPSHSPPHSIGAANNGCIAGALALPLQGTGYWVTHLERGRYYGHPVLIQTIQTLSQQAQQHAIGVLQIGDLSQARGGAMPFGHRSHQTGLDADIWFNLNPELYANADAQRSNIKPPSMLNEDGHSLNEAIWSDKQRKLLQLAAQLPEVDRIFVNPYIKRDLCEKVTENRAWLQKIRPWYHHDDHFHLRLRCPKTSPECKTQSPVPDGEDCGDGLAWWFENHSPAPPAKEKPIMPTACQALLSE